MPVIVRAVGDDISELRIHHGRGYRIYFIRNGDEFILLICGGGKGSQDRDIKAAKRLLAEWKAGDGSPDQHI